MARLTFKLMVVGWIVCGLGIAHAANDAAKQRAAAASDLAKIAAKWETAKAQGPLNAPTCASFFDDFKSVGQKDHTPEGLLDAGVGALEIEAVGDFLVGLLDRVLDFGLVHFGDDVE